MRWRAKPLIRFCWAMLFSGPVLGRLVMEWLVFAVSDWMLTPNRTEPKAQPGLKTYKMCKYFHLRPSFGCSINIYSAEVAIFASNFRSSHAGSLCTNVEEKTGLWGMLYFDAHAGFVYDVTDTDCWVQNGSTHGRAFANRWAQKSRGNHTV